MQENRPEIRNLQYLRSNLHTIDPRLIRTYMSTSSDASSTSSNKSNLELLEINRSHGQKQKAALEPNSSGSRRSMLLRSKKDNVEAAKRKLKNMLLRTRKRNNSNLEDQRKQNLKKIIWASFGLRNWKEYPPHSPFMYLYISKYYVKKERLYCGRVAINSKSLIFISCHFFVTATDDKYDTIDSSACIFTKLSLLLIIKKESLKMKTNFECNFSLWFQSIHEKMVGATWN